ncbi:hypothetical protein WJX72_012519 [[Myrmecia] bisecta]|uniref:RNA polymerase II transcription factor B subunit 2 n=1 Tax=[Myrmecia] bisecta TaxID=41462 RepID=A0AAW1P983_9CHLO
MNLSLYLESLPPIMLSSLYESHYTCQAVLRTLPPVAKQYVLRLLYIDAPISEGMLDSWPSAHSGTKHSVALDKLLRLQVLLQNKGQTGEDLVRLNPAFQHHIRMAVTGRADAGRPMVDPHVLDQAPSRSDVDRYGHQQWEALLLYLAGTNDRPPAASRLLTAPPLQLDRLLQNAELMQSSAEKGITERGWQFLLLDTYNQLWELLQQYISSAENRSGAELSSVVSFMLQLGFQEVGYPTPTATLTAQERIIAAHMAQLGLLLPFKVDDEVWYCATPLALALSGGTSPDAHQQVGEGFVIVETNYRVYAYTNSPLQYAILRSFVRCECILPNLFVGTLTRESVTTALASGISADQIINYLRQHAHKHAAARVPIVPEVVSDQIRLWQADTMRVRSCEATLYDEFESDDVFGKAAAYARTLMSWLWQDTKKRRFAAKKGTHDQMREYIKSIKGPK